MTRPLHMCGIPETSPMERGGGMQLRALEATLDGIAFPAAPFGVATVGRAVWLALLGAGAGTRMGKLESSASMSSVRPVAGGGHVLM
eukprot:11571223-Ditylum_brightwellii.AAC.1